MGDVTLLTVGRALPLNWRTEMVEGCGWMGVVWRAKMLVGIVVIEVTRPGVAGSRPQRAIGLKTTGHVYVTLTRF